MPYAARLDNLIKQSGLSAKEVAQRCTDMGHKVTASYISILRRPENERIPSDDMSRALAKACEAENPEILVIEAYLDKAPPEFDGLLSFLRRTLAQITVKGFANMLGKEEMEEFCRKIEEMPLADVVISFQQYGETADFEKLAGASNIVESTTGDGYTVTSTLNAATGFVVGDDSMFPTLPENCQVILETKELAEYKDGDILAYIAAGDEAIQYRKAAFLNPQHTQIALFALNTDYETKTYAADEIAILGRVRQVIASIK